MELESKVGQLLFVGIEGTEESSDLREFLEEFKPGGIVLFARNIQSPDQVRRFCAFLSAAVDPAPFLSIDQEGGRVNRLSPLVGPLPPAAALARQTKKDMVREFGIQTGRALKALGFNMDFAPCVDLSTPEATNGIAERAFGNDARTVVRLAGAFLDGLQSEGVAGVLKHFPGLGPTDADTHLSLPTSGKSVQKLWEEDLLPFRSLGQRAAAIMVAHAHYASLDADRKTPASLSSAVVGGLLHERMDYRGISIPDDLEMGAVSEQGPPDELSLRALVAGCDMAMFCKSRNLIEEAFRGLVRAGQAGRLPEERLDRSLARILADKERFAIRKVPPTLPRGEFESARLALRQIAETCST